MLEIVTGTDKKKCAFIPQFTQVMCRIRSVTVIFYSDHIMPLDHTSSVMILEFAVLRSAGNGGGRYIEDYWG